MSEIEVKLIDIYKKISLNILLSFSSKKYEDIPCPTRIENDVDINSEISREVGFDSLGMVDFIIQIEEGFDIQLDSYLSEIRTSGKLSDIVRIVQNAKLCS